jgi:hypothetical protein
MRILVRAAWLFAIGGVLEALGTDIDVILGVYALLFVLALPFLRWPPQRLLVAAAVLAVVTPPVDLLLAHFAEANDAFDIPFFSLAVTGAYPRGSAKSVTCGLTCGDGKQRPGSAPWAARVAPCLQGDRSVPCQVSASRRSLCQRHKHIGHPTASSPRWHRRRSEPWLTTLPTPCGPPCDPVRLHSLLHRRTRHAERAALRTGRRRPVNLSGTPSGDLSTVSSTAAAPAAG